MPARTSVSRSKSKSKSRPPAKPHAKPRRKKGLQTPIYANFVVPLAGVLSAVSARLYDMGSQPSKQTDENERAPLLNDQTEEAQRGPETRVQKAASWFAHNAVIVFIGVLITAVIIILCVFFGQYQANKPTIAALCETPACVHAASEILYNLDPDYKNIDACEDFEQLTCGGWDSRHDLRPDQGDAFTGTIMSENSQMLLRHILEAPYPDESKHSSFSPAALADSASSVDHGNFDKLKAAYDACMDQEEIKKQGIKPLMELLGQVSEMFPVKEAMFDLTTPKITADKDEIADTTLFLAKLGVSSLISPGAGADDKDPDVVVVQVSPPYRIGLPAKDYYSDDKVVQKYQTAITQVIDSLHANRSKEYAKEIVEFEKLLAGASPDAEDRDDVTKYYNPMSLSDADGLAPTIRLSKIIKSLAPADVKTQRVIVLSPDYLRSLSNILAKTSRETLQAYFMWKVVQSFTSVLDADELKPYSRFINELQGKDPESSPERWRECVEHVDDGLGWILSRFFVEKAFSAKAKDFGDQIVSDIKEMFIEKLKSVRWMDKTVAKLGIDKVHQIVQKIGYPTTSPNITSPTNLYTYYSSVTVSNATFFKNALAFNRFGVAKEWSSLGRPVDRASWGMTVPTVNAYYNPPGNEIVFPAGIMQFPVFDVNVPEYLSYGAFGAVSGHELSHAFDSTGRHYDQNGNYTDWWDQTTVDGFTERADCFVDQYHNYTIPGPDDKPLHVNGKLTLGENIADAGGISASFAAWKKRQAEKASEDLPGLDHFTQDQLFFVSYANWWCGKSRKETAISRIYTDPHAPKWARILGTMANSRDFKRAFGCKTKEPVCELW